MGAVAFSEVAIFKGVQNGRAIHIPLSVSDIAGEYATAPDGNGFVQLPADQNYALTDMIVVVGGTDTKYQDLYGNGLALGLRAVNVANLNTAVNRQFQGNAPVFKAGTLLRFKQATT